jgi:hypothetical protein
MTPLCELAQKFGSDKSGHHNYTPTYYALLKDRTVKRVLEIGIGDAACMWVITSRGLPYRVGASLYMWEEFFPEASIFGFDIKEDILINAGRIKSFAADQYSAFSLRRAVDEAGGGNFDLIVDDGCHEPPAQINAMQTLLPYLSATGVYVMEDLCPYKLPNCDTSFVTNMIPAEYQFEVVVAGHGGEALVIIQRR